MTNVRATSSTSPTSTNDTAVPSARSGHVCVKFGNRMFTWGGFREHEQDTVVREHYVRGRELWSYDIELKKWYKEPVQGDCPRGLSGSNAVCVGDFMYVIGGFPSFKTWFCRLNLKTHQWTDLSAHVDNDLLTPLDKHICWPYEDKLIIFGGFGPPLNENSKGLWVQDPDSVFSDGYELYERGWNNAVRVYHIKEQRWTEPETKGTSPCPRASHAGVVLRNRGYMFGGRFQDRRRSDMYYLDLDTMTWHECNTKEAVKPEGRSWHSLTPASPTHLLMCGGFNTDCTPLTDIWLFNTETNQWTQMEKSLPKPRLWHTAVIGQHLGEVILFGGCTNNILSTESCSEHTNEVHHIFFSPKSLTRLCFEEIKKHRTLLKNQVHFLPSVLRQKAQHFFGA